MNGAALARRSEMTLVRCEFCGRTQNEPRRVYDVIFDDLFKQTPAAVWKKYLADGYTMHEAILMERSYA
jgi:hypothetical protein